MLHCGAWCYYSMYFTTFICISVTKFVFKGFCFIEKVVIFTVFKLIVFLPGLPSSGSWQDLKDHMREAGDVCFADAFKDGTGVVEFLRLEDMKYAVKKLDDSRFRSHEVRQPIFYTAAIVIFFPLSYSPEQGASSSVSVLLYFSGFRP